MKPSDSCETNATRLEIALQATRPIETHIEPIALDELWRERDNIDEAAADPIHDHRPQSAPGHKVNRVIGILDQLDKENVNRRFNA